MAKINNRRNERRISNLLLLFTKYKSKTLRFVQIFYPQIIQKGNEEIKESIDKLHYHYLINSRLPWKKQYHCINEYEVRNFHFFFLS